MPTDLKKPVVRRTIEPHDYHNRRIVVILEPGDVIGFREERCRKVFRAPISKVFRQVVRWNAEAEHSKKKKRHTRTVNRSLLRA